MARPVNDGETQSFEVTLSKQYYEYRRVLARRKGLGPSANTVAAYLLTQRIEVMIAEKYHDREIPTFDGVG
jgi:hypothetical protein